MTPKKTLTSSSSSLSKPKIAVFDFSQKKVAKVEVNHQLWNVEVNQQVVHDVLVAQQACERQGTKKTKTRGEVSGGGKKPWKQKGTGRARHGSIRSPIWKGGGVVFGPTFQENYAKKINRKTYRKAICMILSDALANKQLFFWKDEDFLQPSTKKILEILTIFKFKKEKILFVVPDNFPNLLLSTNNLSWVTAINLVNINPYYLLNADKILIHSQLLPDLEKRLIYF